MRYLKLIIGAVLLTILFQNCDKIKDKKDKEMMNESNQEPKVTGIGGIFFKSEDTEKLKQWYALNLGLEVNDYGSTFEFRNANKPEETNYLQWSPFESKTDYFQPSQKDFMINYRVQGIEKLVAKLKANGVTILDEIEQYEYGKFVHILDAEGNKIELWEPVDEELTKIGSKTTK